MVNISGSLIGLSILSGSNTLAPGTFAAIESSAVRLARARFTTPATTPPWKEPAPKASVSSQIEAIKRMRTIIETSTNPKLAGLPDVQTSFTAFKALEKLRLLAETAAKPGTPESDRKTLQTAFAKGMADLQAFLSKAPGNLLSLHFDQPSRAVQSIGVAADNSSGEVAGTGVSAARDAPLAGLTGNEILRIDLSKYNLSASVTVDLSQTPQPPTLDSVASALNAAIASLPMLDAGGNPVLDGDGNVRPRWNSSFTVGKTDGQWGLNFQAAGVENVAIDQIGAPDRLIVVSGQTYDDVPGTVKVMRFDDLLGTPVHQTVATIGGIDRAATAAAVAGTKASTDKDAPVQGDVYAQTEARAIATDAQGFSYVVGTTAGDLGYSRSDGEDDLFLTKLDSEGKIVWQRTLGAAGEAKGAAISLAANGDVIVAGTVKGPFNGSTSDDTDMLVVRFSANGDEQFATSLGGLGDDSANAVTVGADGSIYVAGKTSTGGSDGYVARLDAAGKVQERRVIDSGGADTISALAIDASGNLLMLTREGTNAKIRSLDAAALSIDLGSFDLGTVDARAIAVSASGQIAVAGSTSMTVTGAQVNAINGGRDGFVTRIDAGLTSASTTYIGSAADDQVDSIGFTGDMLYVGGRTTGALNGALRGIVDGFVSRIDGLTGALGATSQFGISGVETEPVRMAVSIGGGGITGALGLHRGTMNAPDSSSLTARTNMRAGDSFSIRMDGGLPRTVTIEAGETLETLADKIRRITGAKAVITTPKLNGLTTLKIEAKGVYTLELIAGSTSVDALEKLNLKPGKIAIPKSPGPKDPKVLPGGSYGLGLGATFSLMSTESAGIAAKKINSAISMTQTAYRSLYWDESKAALVDGSISGRGSAYQQAQLAQYKAALSRLTGVSQ
ncbi:SBBP repeat-containing protein [Sphingobium boeckii]|uniref:Regulatory protein FlaEY n=1 Tax=Sphingobium boeckii TaxID=1082345 RepID=A0A7W9AGN5_9SPHN|nr:SBBP repeat-containing protein [Sphingobium boeckii]MBB5685275.1 hypothetical protein [Sphingobium boeckii]